MRGDLLRTTVVAVVVVLGVLVTTPVHATNVLIGAGSANQHRSFSRFPLPPVTPPPSPPPPSFPSIASLNSNKGQEAGGKGGERNIFLSPSPTGGDGLFGGRDGGNSNTGGTTDLGSLFAVLDEGGAGGDDLLVGSTDGFGLDGLGPDGLGADGLGPDGIGLDEFGLDGLGFDGMGIEAWDSNDFSNALFSLLGDGGLDEGAGDIGGAGTLGAAVGEIAGGALTNLTDIFFSLMDNDELLAQATINLPAISDPTSDPHFIPSDVISDRTGLGGGGRSRRRRSKCLTILRILKAITGGNRRRNRNNSRRNNRRNERRNERQERREERREERQENRNDRREERRDTRNERLEDRQDRRQERREDRLDRREEKLEQRNDNLQDQIRRERRRRRRQRRNALLARIFCFFVDAAKSKMRLIG